MEKKSVKDQPKELSFIDCTVKHNNEILNVVEMKKIRVPHLSAKWKYISIDNCMLCIESWIIWSDWNPKFKRKNKKGKNYNSILNFVWIDYMNVFTRLVIV